MEGALVEAAPAPPPPEVDGEFLDFVLRVNGAPVAANATLLRMRSNAVREMFTGGAAEAAKMEWAVRVDGVSPAAAAALVDYVHGRPLRVGVRDFEGAWLLARYMQVPHAVAALEDTVRRTVVSSVLLRQSCIRHPDLLRHLPRPFEISAVDAVWTYQLCNRHDGGAAAAASAALTVLQDLDAAELRTLLCSTAPENIAELLEVLREVEKLVAAKRLTGTWRYWLKEKESPATYSTRYLANGSLEFQETLNLGTKLNGTLFPADDAKAPQLPKEDVAQEFAADADAAGGRVGPRWWGGCLAGDEARDYTIWLRYVRPTNDAETEKMYSICKNVSRKRARESEPGSTWTQAKAERVRV